MDFTFTDDQLTFREAVSRFLMTEAAPEMLREIWETDTGRSPVLRKNIAEQGLTALSVPEECGGLGMDDVAWALMTQELGYYAIPDSLADAAYVAAGLISALPAATAEREAWLARIAEGSIRIAVGHPVNPLVADANPADLLLLAHGDEVHAVPRAQVEIEANASIDLSRRLARVRWMPATATLIADGEAGRALWAQTLNRGALSTAGQLLGLAQRMLDLSVDYVAQRKQFGKPIGSFQALQHKATDLYVQQELTRAVLQDAVRALDAAGSAPERARLASRCKARASEAGLRVTREVIQLHGAIGFTDEYDAGLYLKRALVLSAGLGNGAAHRRRFASLRSGQVPV